MRKHLGRGFWVNQTSPHYHTYPTHRRFWKVHERCHLLLRCSQLLALNAGVSSDWSFKGTRHCQLLEWRRPWTTACPDPALGTPHGWDRPVDGNSWDPIESQRKNQIWGLRGSGDRLLTIIEKPLSSVHIIL